MVRVYPSCLLEDGFVHLFFPNISRPTAFCGVAVNKPEDDDPQAAVANQMKPLSVVTCPACLAKAAAKGFQ